MNSEVGLTPQRRPSMIRAATGDDVLAGMLASPKRLPARLLYDARGARLFERICALDAYYLTRVELALLRAHARAIAEHVGERARMIEPGSGAGVKTRLVLDALEAPASIVAIDVSADQLAATTRQLRAEYPGLAVDAVCADYTSPFALPPERRASERTLVFFPGSTIGNLEPAEAVRFLAHLGRLAGPRGTLVLGSDSTNDPERLLAAYDDPGGVTAEFDRNVLAHVNRIRGATFDPSTFEHRAVWNAAQSRIEMHLVSRGEQTVVVAGVPIAFRRGEPIVTEHCYKLPTGEMAALLEHAGWHVRRLFTADEHDVHLWMCDR